MPQIRAWLPAFLFCLTIPPAPTRAVVQQPSLAALEVGAGFVAKRVASGVFLSGRGVDSILEQEFAAETPLDMLLKPLVRVSLDREARRITARILGISRTAVYRNGLGCTLASGVTVEQLEQLAFEPVPLLPEHPERLDWPLGDRTGVDDPATAGRREALERALDGAFAEPKSGPRARTRAVVVLHRGWLVAERYAPGFDRHTRLEGWSMAKSVIDALVGIRVGQGELDLDRPTGLAQWQQADDPRRALTLDDLLRMSSGLRWKEVYTDLEGGPARMLFAEPDAGRFAAGFDQQHTPGTHWKYSSGTTNIISRLLRDSFQRHADYLHFPREQLFNRIGMRSAVFEVDSAGSFVGSSLLFANARDWARLGLLYLQDGIFQGQKILPEGWVARSLTPAPAAPRGSYGRHWWLNVGQPERPGNRPFPKLPPDLFLASGFEGQALVVIPSKQLVIVRLGCTKVPNAFRLRSFLEQVVAAATESRSSARMTAIPIST